MSSSNDFLASTLLSRAHDAETTSTLYKSHILHRPLLLRPTSPDPPSTTTPQNARTKRQHLRAQKSQQTSKHSKAKPRPLSAKQKRALQPHSIPKSQQKYPLYIPLHNLWLTYMREILGLTPPSSKTYIDPLSAGPLLVSADYHGALITVVRSKCVSRVGISGIVVRETKFTFEVVTRGDGVKSLPKEGTVFRVEVSFGDEGEGGEGKGEDTKGGEGEGGEETSKEKEKRKPLVLDIFGDRFLSRAPERANKKFKGHIVDL